MATSKEFIDYLVDQMREAGVITARKMFGEYGLYCDGKNFAFVCDDRLLIKPTEAGAKTWENLPYGALYEGARAKYFYVEDVDDRERLIKLVTETCRDLPEPKPKPIQKRRQQ